MSGDGRRRTKLSVSRRPGSALLIGDALLIFGSRGHITIRAPESTKIFRGEELEGFELDRFAEDMRGPYTVDGGRSCAELADAAQVAELKHRDGAPVAVRDKYGEQVYLSQGAS